MLGGKRMIAPIHTAPFFEVLDIEATQDALNGRAKVVFLQCRALPSRAGDSPSAWYSGLAPGWAATGWRLAANVPSQDALVTGPDGSGVAVQVEPGVVLPGAL